MIHISVFRENPEIIFESLRKRQDTEKLGWAENVIKWDKKVRELKKNADDLRAMRNKLSQEINEKKKKGEDASVLLAKVKNLPNEINDAEKEVEELEKKILEQQMRIPNILHESVPYGKSDQDNAVVKKWGKPRKDAVKNHFDWAVEKGYADIERAAKTSGSRFYYLKGKLARLRMGVLNYAVDMMEKHKFTQLSIPYLLHRKIMEGATDLADFDEVLYKVEGEDLYLVPTAEHGILGYHNDDTLNEEGLPQTYFALSPAFRKEAGVHGKDTKGIFRVHQFEKVEMFVYCSPEESWKWHEKLLKIEEEVAKGLKIPYRIVNICTGDIGTVAAKKYDIEAWMPASQEYRELGSCSNCTAYQSVRSNIRLRRKSGEKEWAHTLNATVLADTRTLVALIENNMQKNGSVKVPAALKKYVGFSVLE